MSFKKYYSTILFCLCGLFATAQDIDLGGEDTAVGPLAPPPNSQVIAGGWMEDLLQGESLYISPTNQNMGNDYKFMITDNPGETISYDKLNLLFFLKDYAGFQAYFLHRMYTKKRSLNAIDDDLITYFYPIVREYVAGSKSFAKNPRYMFFTKGEEDGNYTLKYESAIILDSLYEQALEMPAMPTAKPYYLFDRSRDLFKQDVPNVIDELEAKVKSAMQEIYKNQHPQSATLPIDDWSENERNSMLNAVAQLKVKKKDKGVVKELSAKISQAHITLQKDYTALLIMHTKQEEHLSSQEQIWFDWVIKNCAQIVADLKVNLDYLQMVEDLAVKETTYTHFINASSLLRETTLRMRNLPKESEANQVLDQLTAEYLSKVKADEVRFNDL